MTSTDGLSNSKSFEDFGDIQLKIPLAMRVALKKIGKLKTGSLIFTLPGGHVWKIRGQNAGPTAEATIHDWRVFSRTMSAGDIGLADSYVAGEFETPDLAAFLTVCSLNYDSVRHLAVGDAITRFINAVRHRILKRNSKQGSRKNILAHYDLGNDFYERWLDPTMTYSSAIFTQDEQSLEDAQKEKYRRIARESGAKPGAHLLEIGCGWGGFAEIAAKEFGARVTSLTISDAQFKFAKDRMARLGLQDLVEIRHQDYRDTTGQFDGIASIEMFEAVGEEYWPTYFSKVKEVLKPGGRASLQIITIDDDLFESYRKRADFIQHHIFPGGMLPSDTALEQQTQSAGLVVDQRFMFGKDYAETLRQWLNAFDQAWSDIASVEFDERFRRLWRFYMAYCEAGFETGRIDVGQFTLKHA